MAELIKISEFRRRVFGKDAKHPTPQTIRNQLERGELPGERFGKPWFVDWTAYSRRTGDDLVDAILSRSRA